jgi:hypothetical protein
MSFSINMIILKGLHYNNDDYGILFYNIENPKRDDEFIIEIIGSDGIVVHVTRNEPNDIMKFKIRDDTGYCIIIRSKTQPLHIYETKIYNIRDVNITEYNSFEESDEETIQGDIETCDSESDSGEIELKISYIDNS